VEARWREDPIARLEELLRQAGQGDGIASHREETEREMREVYEEAKATPFPLAALAFADVQDSGDPRQDAF
jgi:TPP-dependent pyruvate/acetoin dehydrogenase alpha subunit